jgi:hypothetical protein
MKLITIILIIIAVIILLITLGFAYMGMFSKLEIKEQPMGPYILVYERFVGPYEKTGAVFDKVTKNLKAEGITTTRGLGIYFDNPKITPKDKLRSECGNIIEKKDLDKLIKIKNKFNIKKIPKNDSLVIEFPIRNTLSYMLGPIKCYPALVKYANKKNFNIKNTYEIYDVPNKKTYFVVVKKNQ